MMLKTMRKHGVTLALFAAGSTGLTAAINELTKSTIDQQAALQQKALFDQVLPADRYNNDLLKSCYLVSAPARKVVEVRKTTVGWVSQFLRVIPRISTLEVVMQPLLNIGVPRDACAAKAAQLLTRLNVPERLWHLAPSTFSGGEQQRVNIARGFAVDYPILLLDEPTASLDAKNSAAVVDLIHDAKARGAAIVGIFHDEGVRRQVADRLHPMGMTA